MNQVDWSQIAKFMGQTWGPPGSCRPQMGPMLAPIRGSTLPWQTADVPSVHMVHTAATSAHDNQDYHQKVWSLIEANIARSFHWPDHQITCLIAFLLPNTWLLGKLFVCPSHSNYYSIPLKPSVSNTICLESQRWNEVPDEYLLREWSRLAKRDRNPQAVRVGLGHRTRN